jgi:hypothetical protein
VLIGSLPRTLERGKVRAIVGTRWSFLFFLLG